VKRLPTIWAVGYYDIDCMLLVVFDKFLGVKHVVDYSADDRNYIDSFSGIYFDVVGNAYVSGYWCC